MAQLSTVRAVDNSFVSVNLDGVTEDELHNWTGNLRYTPRYGGRGTTADAWGFNVAPRDALGAGVSGLRATERQRFAYSGGEIIVYDCADMPESRWAAWVGPWNMAHCMFHTPNWEPNDIVQHFSRVQFTDTPEGLTSSGGRRFNLRRASYFLPVPGVGTLAVQPKHLNSTQVPGWRGFSTGAGEVWRMSSKEGLPYEWLMLVTQTAVVKIDPWDVPRRGVTEVAEPRPGAEALSAAADFLTGRVLNVTWGA
ncbi:hypothetical protein AB0395_05635 [Streptosporangium sp. NPDC051023]|uniref:hypothetical protein n=1 Tax=Streptosporangium sp. NPDC051023 TaxID=3155410 RepID=UPI00344D233A